MDLTTRCPSCGTAFQASLADLQLRKGYIRCVQCAHIFDGYAEVVSATAEPTVPPDAAPVAGDSPIHTAAGADSPSVFRSGRGAQVDAQGSHWWVDPQAGEQAPQWRIDPQLGEQASQGRIDPQAGEQAPQWRIDPQLGEQASQGRIDPQAGEQAPQWRIDPQLGEQASQGRIDPQAGEQAPQWRIEDPQTGEQAPQWRIEDPQTGAQAPQWRTDSRADAAPDVPEAIVVEARPGFRHQGGSAAPLLRTAQGASWWQGLLRVLSSLLLLLLGLLAVAQLAYVYRAQLAQAAPALRPWLLQACVPLRCQVPYARNLGDIVITSSALKIQDPLADSAPDRPSDNPPEGGGLSASPPAPEAQQYVLQATLRNQAAYPQEWPSLILDLKDAAGTLMVRRNLAPADYLGAEVTQQPLPAHSDVRIQLPFTLNGLKINGYQLDLFYP